MLCRAARVARPMLQPSAVSLFFLKRNSHVPPTSHMEVVRDYLEKFGNLAENDPASYLHHFDKNFQKECVIHSLTSRPPGMPKIYDYEGLVHHAQTLHKIFAKCKGTIHRLAGTTEGEVVAEYELQGETHSGKFYHGTYCLFFELNEEGKIVRERQYIDTQEAQEFTKMKKEPPTQMQTTSRKMVEQQANNIAKTAAKMASSCK
eukprot:g10508.t1